MSTDYVGLLERGERLPSLPVLLAVADALGSTLATLLADPSPDPGTSEAVALFRALKPDHRDAALAMLRGLAQTPPPRQRRR